MINLYQSPASQTSIYSVYIKAESICRIARWKRSKNFILKNPCKMNNYVNFQNGKNAGNPASKNSSFWTFDQGYIDISGHAGA